MDSLELGIRDALANLCADPRVSEPGWDWHGEAIRAVGEVAQRAGHIWLPNLGAPAWLWDGVALERGSSTDLWSGALVGIPLVLEVDWGGRSDVLYDFKKLLVARAEHRVMVSGTRANRSGASQCAAWLVDVIRRFQHGQSGDRYFLASWYPLKGTAGGEFLFQLYVAP